MAVSSVRRAGLANAAAPCGNNDRSAAIAATSLVSAGALSPWMTPLGPATGACRINQKQASPFITYLFSVDMRPATIAWPLSRFYAIMGKMHDVRDTPATMPPLHEPTQLSSRHFDVSLDNEFISISYELSPAMTLGSVIREKDLRQKRKARLKRWLSSMRALYSLPASSITPRPARAHPITWLASCSKP
jgi:hypothetical protein